MRFFLACLPFLSLLLPALSSPFRADSDDDDYGPFSEEIEAYLDSQKGLRHGGGYSCIWSHCWNENEPHNICEDGYCFMSGDNGILICGCPDSSEQDQPTSHGIAPTPQTTNTKSPVPPPYGSPPTATMICDEFHGICIGPDFSGPRCKTPKCGTLGSNGRACSCASDESTSLWPYGVPGIPTSGVPNDPSSSTGSVTTSIEDGKENDGETTTDSSPKVKRTKTPCPSPRVNPQPPFNFICPGDEDDGGVA